METAPSPSSASRRQRLVVAAGIGAAVLGFSAAILPHLAVPAMTLGLITFLAQPPATSRGPRAARLLLLVAAPFALVGLLRFTVEDAMAGIVEGGHRALVTRAIAKLRVLRFTEDIAREQAVWDPDGDGIGSALLLEEMRGEVPMRGQRETPLGLLEPIGALADTPAGKALVADGYAILLYLPGVDGRGVARPGVPIDDERAERRWVAYAWPLEEGAGEHPVIFIDEHERILQLANQAPGPRYFGLESPPPFDAALAGPTLDAPAADDAVGRDGGKWTRWKGKEARDHLPGDGTERR